MNNLGVSTNELTIDQVMKLGLKRVEVCLGRRGKYQDRLNKLIKDIELCEKNNIQYSIHLPVYLFDWFDYDYLAAFFLDEDENKRKISFKLLSENLNKLNNFNPEYYVLHFPGINFDQNDEIERLIKNSLNKINQLALEFDVKILLEYFGSNRNFYDYKMWTEIIPGYSNLGILLDTGHLYFSSILNDFDFYDAFYYLIDYAEAFHLWTTKGNLPYKRNEFYRKYHHIPVDIQQSEDNGWAFDVQEILERIKEKDKPTILEASDYYKGRNYYLECLNSLISYFKDGRNEKFKGRNIK